MVSKATNEAVAKAKQFYKEEMAKKQGAGVKSSSPTKSPGSAKSNSKRKPHPKPNVATQKTRRPAAKKPEPTQKPKSAIINKKKRADDIKKALQYYKHELERKTKNNVDLRRTASLVAEQQYFEDAADDPPLLVSESERATNTHRQEYDGKLMTHTGEHAETTRAACKKETYIATKILAAKNLFAETMHVSPLAAGAVVVVLVAILFEQSLTTTFSSIVAVMRYIAWELVRATTLVAAVGAGIYLTIWAYARVRKMHEKQQIQFRRNVLEIKTRVYEILRADPGTGVTVASLREELMVDTKRRTFDKIWAKVSTDVYADARVVKFVGGEGMEGCEEEVWQWYVPSSARPQNQAPQSRLRRVVFNTNSITSNTM